MRIPDYQGGSIVNLMASILRGRGGTSEHPPLRLLPPEEIAEATNVVLLVLDGLGADWLARRSPDGILSGHLRGAIDTVFPATTASAITCFLTGDAPRGHAITGWHTYLRELGCVLSVLPGAPRYGGVSYRKAGIDPARLFGHVPLFDRIATPSVCVSPRDIARSDYNLAHLGRARLAPYRGLHGLFRKASQAVRRGRGPKYVYAYWPRLDAIGHKKGMESDEAAAHLKEIEQALAGFLEAVVDRDTLLLVTADHGQVDTTEADRIDLADHPDLRDCLALPLCGEPRAAFCYVRAHRTGDFEDYCRWVLGDTAELHPSRELVERGLFGPGQTHPRLGERIGDYVLLMRGNRVIRERLPFEDGHVQVGTHGGLSETELRVPLCVIRL